MAPEDVSAGPKIGMLRARAGRSLSPLVHDDFRRLIIGSGATGIANWVQQIAKGLLVFHLTDSYLQLGLVMFAQGFPMFLSSPIGGALADRFDQRTVIWMSQAVMSMVGVALALLVLTDVVAIWHIYVLAVMSGILFGINGPPRQAIVYDLVGPGDLRQAIALNSMVQNMARVLGPLMGAGLVAVIGLEGAFFLQAAGYLVGMVTVLMIQTRSPRRASSAVSLLSNLREGLAYVRPDRLLNALVIIAVINAGMAWPYMNLMPAFAVDTLGLSDSGFGLLMAGAGAGAFIGATGVVFLGESRHGGHILVWTVLGMGCGLVAMSLTDLLPLIAALVVGMGLFSAVQQILNNTLIQVHVDDRYRGRVTSLYFQTWGLTPVGGLAISALAEAIGLQEAFFVTGLAILAVTLWLYAASPIRRA